MGEDKRNRAYIDLKNTRFPKEILIRNSPKR